MTLNRLIPFALLLLFLSGCAYGTYNTPNEYGGLRGTYERPIYMRNCPFYPDQESCYRWFYGDRHYGVR